MSGTRTNLGGKAEKDLGGSASAVTEEPVSTAPGTPVDRPAPVAPPQAFAPAEPVQEPLASGRDDPNENEHDHQHQRLDGVSAQRVKTAAEARRPR